MKSIQSWAKLFCLGLVSVVALSPMAQAEKICRKNQFAKPDCDLQQEWSRYCSIETLCFEGTDVENSDLSAIHQDGRKVNYTIKSWDIRYDWHGRKISTLTFTQRGDGYTDLGKLWIHYDDNNDKPYTLLAYTPDGYDFQTGSPE